ncbi:patatin-like phospholipase family protein [Methylotenera sp. 1P/1]|uniref:patatin-like phospholipase family protein n=1 Tax=Methylotenera sp. 1P/1 TaxID=1131551 RepID=UPI0012F7188A|nr:patatin-like phospholipase family protein [Methylotenera sp. 1P/1]
MASPEKYTPDQLAAHRLLTELRTRIAVQPLPYQYGIEARALESLYELFKIARQAIKDYPGCQNFAQITTNILNVDIRPMTAKWHRAYKAGVLDSRDGANEFRSELAKLQIKLEDFSLALQMMAYQTQIKDELTPPVISKDEIESIFHPIKYGIDISTDDVIANAKEINKFEFDDIVARRANYNIKKEEDKDAVGLALSGGGIRSATFCLGVVQVLAERRLMKDFDYLSTVSGGGYIGSFLSALVSGKNDFEKTAKPYGPDTDDVRHVRQNAKYLSSVDLKQRWSMAIGLIIGLLLNWTGPLSVISLVAYAVNQLSNSPEKLLFFSAFSAALISISILIYGMVLNNDKAVKIGRKVIFFQLITTLVIFTFYLVEKGYSLFFQSFHWPYLLYMLVMVIGIPAIVRFLPLFGTPSNKKIILNGIVWLAGAIVPLLIVTIYYYLRLLGSLQQDNSLSFWSPLSHWSGNTILLIIGAVFALVTFFLNVNLTGLNKLYRDQLSRTFIQDLEIPLSKLNSKQWAPYHLINATINLPSSINRKLRDRRGDFFIFSKYWSGSAATGYHKTESWLPKVDLGTAMAISGAAASPQMGTKSKPTLAALLTLLNVRLGYWILKYEFKKPYFKSPGFLCLLREMTGFCMSENSKWLNLSDGGHIENMGIYELLRRRCKFIVCVDGESDPQSTFEGKLTLVRHAQIDFGIRLEPKFDDIRLNPESKFSRSHSHLLRIHYPSKGTDQPAEIGLMLYLKLSLTGDETELLKRYRMINPDFPHQSTIDQFYDEEQFEVYRQLGVHVAEGVFSPALLTKNSNPKDIEEWFRQLASNMLEPTKS